MKPFSYARAHGVAEAIRLAQAGAAKYLGGGTNLVDLMRETIERPTALVDVSGGSKFRFRGGHGSYEIGE